MSTPSEQQQQAGLCWILFAGSGNLTEDMEGQLQANTIRMEVLQRENTQLQALLAKVKAAAEQGVLKVSWVPWGGCCVPQNPVAPRHALRIPRRAKPRLHMLLGGRSGLTGVA